MVDVADNTSRTLKELFKEADDEMYRMKLLHNQSFHSSIVQTLMKALEARDFITEGHGERIKKTIEAVGIVAIPWV